MTLARTLGLAAFELEVANVRAESCRDTRGPGSAGFKRLLAALDGRKDAKGLRDRAILRLLYDLALRRGEVAALDVADLDLGAGTLSVLGKGRTAKVKLTLPAPTQHTLAEWLAARGSNDGPLFTSMDRAAESGQRLTDRSIHRLVRTLGASVGLATWPHALRHAAITTDLDATGGDLRAVQRFSRHKNVSTVLVYDDSRRDLAGGVAKMVAESVENESAKDSYRTQDNDRASPARSASWRRGERSSAARRAARRTPAGRVADGHRSPNMSAAASRSPSGSSATSPRASTPTSSCSSATSPRSLSRRGQRFGSSCSPHSTLRASEHDGRRRGAR